MKIAFRTICTVVLAMLFAVPVLVSCAKPYEIFNPDKVQKMVYDAGKPVYELVDPDGHAYVMQARGHQFPIETLAELGKKFQHLPEGWSYRTRVLEKELVLDLNPAKATIYGTGDEFHQYYTRISEGE